MQPSRAGVKGAAAGGGGGGGAAGGGGPAGGRVDVGAELGGLEGPSVSRPSLEETRKELVAEGVKGQGGAERDAMVDLVDGLMALEAGAGAPRAGP